MSSSLRLSPVRHSLLLAAAVAFAAGTANAQLAYTSDASSSASPAAVESSSSDGAALPAAPAASGSGASSGAAQEGGYHSHSYFSRMTFEAGGGANGPLSDSNTEITWGGNFTVGAGYRINPMFSVLTEYQFMDDKLPGSLIAEAGASGGNAHIWSFTVDPVVDLMPKSHNSIYVTGGGGFYRKVTNFTVLEPSEYCTYFYCGIGYSPQVVGHYSSNQGGWNIGGGFQHKMGGVYGDSKMRLFAEVRYLDVMSPAVTTSANGLGTTTVPADTKLLPITLGIRF
jgi:hypothetical protein